MLLAPRPNADHGRVSDRTRWLSSARQGQGGENGSEATSIDSLSARRSRRGDHQRRVVYTNRPSDKQVKRRGFVKGILLPGWRRAAPVPTLSLMAHEIIPACLYS
jgi:hypothetical protein